MKYKTEVGKDFKRLVFYLCKEEEFNSCEEQDEDEEISLTREDHSHTDIFNADLFEDSVYVCDGFDSAEKNEPQQRRDEEPRRKNKESRMGDEAQQISSQVNQGRNGNSCHQTKPADENSSRSTLPPAAGDRTSELFAHIINYNDVVKEVSSKVDHGNQFFMTTRRKVPFPRILSLWKRQAAKCDPTNLLRVHFSGKDGIDSGALVLEFLEECIPEMGKIMFPDGSPVDSSSHVQSGNFRACGQIVAVSLAQGGPPPCFLEQCSYEAGFSELDMMNISKEHLTAKEVKLLDEVRSDCMKYTDLILEHGYTGQVCNEHMDAIIRSLEVSFVSRRCLYMKEFMIGLQSYGWDEIITQKPFQCQPLFVNGDLKEGLTPNADYMFSLMVPQHSKEGTSRRCIEEELIDHLQDTLIAFEDENVTGHTVAMAWNYELQDGFNEETVIDETFGEAVSEEFESPSVNIPGVMGWLTGMQHKPVNGGDPKIMVLFDHECLQRNPKHSICYPLVSACGRTLTLPVIHMRNAEKFREIFLMAYCKGKSFGKP